MGEVYRAVHSKIGRVVAIKVLTPSLVDPSFIERFNNEARIQASLQHANIATLYDFLETNGRPCIVMEYIEGQALTERVRQSGGLTLKESLRIFQAVLEAIEYVHNQGVIHRDIKSNNIKITPMGEVKVLDFGIAKSGSSPSLTVTGGFVGTLQYLSPEQFKGERANVRTDIWALGVLLYEMVTGLMPFEAETIGSLLEKISKCSYSLPSVLNASIPREIESVISRCLKKNPSDRYHSVSELLRDVKLCAAESNPANLHRRSVLSLIPNVRIPRYPTPKREELAIPTPNQLPSRTARRRWLILSAAACVVLLILVGLYAFLADSSNSSVNGGQTKGYLIKVTGGQADVYENGRRIGTTPYDVTAKVNDHIDVTLRREGYEDCPVRFTATENKREYLFTMKEKE